jgi:peptide/nickel transport system substrate-binding protein
VTSEPKELRLKSGKKLIEYINKFSATEKVVFYAFVVTLIISSLYMAKVVNDMFTIEIPAYGGELREALIGLPRTINPILAYTDVDRDVTSLVYSGLMKYDGDNLVSDIAKSYEVAPDGLTYTFEIRDDVYFHDGNKLTTEDIAYTIQKIQDPELKSPKIAEWTGISVRIVSPTKIEFLLKKPYSPFMANTTIGIMPKHIWGNVTNEQFIFSAYNIEPIGSGPFKIDAVERDAGGIPTVIRLTKWSRYYAEKPYIESISFHLFGDEEKAISALVSGNIDSLPSVSQIPAKKLSSNTEENYSVETMSMPRTFGVFFNQNHNSILADKVVRQALDMSIDKNSLVENVLGGYGEVLHGPTNIDHPIESSTSTASGMEMARKLLEKNGWIKNVDTQLYEKKLTKTSATTTISLKLYTVDQEDMKSTGEIISKTWKELGIDIEIISLEQGDLYQNIIKTREYDALLFGMFVGKERDLYALWHSSQRNYPGLNVSMYTNNKVDKLLEDARALYGGEERKKLEIQLHEILEEDMPAIFLYSPKFIYIVPKDLKGINKDAINIPADRFNNINKWYINTQKVWKILEKLNIL